MHIFHLIVGATLKTLNKFTWPAEAGQMLPAAYFTMVGTIANVWRGIGIGVKLKKEAAEMFDTVYHSVSITLFSKIPGKPIQERWGSIDAVEAVLLAVRNYLGQLFAKLFPDKPVGEKKTSKPTGDPHLDAQASDWKERQSRWRSLGRVATMSSILFHFVAIANTASAPLTQFLNWAQKKVKEHNNHRSAATKEDKTYLGAAPLSMLVCTQAQRTKHECVALPTSDANWTTSLPTLPAELQPPVANS